jgi:hypothetical protein
VIRHVASLGPPLRAHANMSHSKAVRRNEIYEAIFIANLYVKIGLKLAIFQRTHAERLFHEHCIFRSKLHYISRLSFTKFKIITNSSENYMSRILM